jgi:hypothetical protein
MQWFDDLSIGTSNISCTYAIPTWFPTRGYVDAFGSQRDLGGVTEF